ncbi:hypothetical protein AB0945_43100 [Streptomyces sp. NPDC005474]|uniref:hypothetical protein n=1 Tax=Streptomyces sp. NPDC005474 TaxID=3154878 RepID=UPI0034542BDF
MLRFEVGVQGGDLVQAVACLGRRKRDGRRDLSEYRKVGGRGLPGQVCRDPGLAEGRSGRPVSVLGREDREGVGRIEQGLLLPQPVVLLYQVVGGAPSGGQSGEQSPP